MNQPTPRRSWLGTCLGLLALSVTSSSCSSTYQLEIRTTPSGAWVYINGEQKGQSGKPFELDFSQGSEVFIQVVYKDYEAGESIIKESEVPKDGRMRFTLRANR